MTLVDVGGGRLHVEEHDGPGSTIVLLHGFAASTFTWRHVAPRLAASHRVIAFDRLGFGRSDRPPHGDYSTRAAVAHLVTVLDGFDVGRATLVAHSAGAVVAVGLALDAPERVDRLVLIAPAIVATGPPPFVRRLFAFPGAAQVGPAVLRTLMPVFFAGALRKTWAVAGRVTPDVVAGYLDPLRVAGTAEALVAMTLGEPAAGDLVERLPLVEAPALVIAGEADPVVRRADAQRVARALRARLDVVADAGHLPHEEQPDVTLGLIEPFVAQ